MDIDIKAEGGHIERKAISKSPSEMMNSQKLLKA